ncbi:chloroplast sensor kinase, chloroplastic-like isoform X2 [Asparagus officinalis]|uniref:chloroplast sensor kinase, chloroplastic-like isoform X2 n=1 Tax=Asparagus officinalis TaxID=4686 RepID=UPI00098E42E0|nr:chloroplast sensor kinase, chloroplastic-like isoform X2 [Asparagus officinalis]
MLLQQSSWQNNVRISHLVEQIRGSLSNIRALSKMLSVHLKRNEISHDITENILMQGDHVKDTLQQLQDAVYLTKDNIVQYNEDMLRRMHDPTYNHQESFKPFLSDYHVREPEEDIAQKMDALLPLGSKRKNVEIPMPPLLLAPIQKHGISEVSHPLHVAVEESALRQALSNLIEGALLRTQIGGRVEIYATSAPAGGTFIAIDDNGPDMHYMTQMRSLTPFRENLLSDGKVEDNVTWNFVAGVAVAREVLENYGCVVRVISPRTPDVMLGARGTRIELWLPSNH